MNKAPSTPKRRMLPTTIDINPITLAGGILGWFGIGLALGRHLPESITAPTTLIIGVLSLTSLIIARTRNAE